MRKVVLMFILISFVSFAASSCIKSGHRQQNWHPKGGKKMKKGQNHPG